VGNGQQLRKKLVMTISKTTTGSGLLGVVVGWWWLLLFSLRMSGLVLELDKPGLRLLSAGLGLSLPPIHQHFL
jgi:hypothetical protein